MSDFQQSTQCNHWTISIVDQVACRRSQYLLAGYYPEESKQTTFSWSNRGVPPNDIEIDATGIANVEEEELIIEDFCKNLIPKLCGVEESCSIRAATWKVASTAVVYFRRFYLFNSLSLHDPRLILCACIFLAGKVEESFISADAMLRLPFIKSLDILLKEEEKVATALDFDLRVFHPQTAIHAFLAEIRCDYSYLNLSYGMDEVNDLIRKWVPRAEKAASILMSTPVALACNPSIIAVSALLHTEDIKMVEQFLRMKFGEDAVRILVEEARELFSFLKEDREECSGITAAAKKKLQQRAIWGKKKAKQSTG